MSAKLTEALACAFALLIVAPVLALIVLESLG